MTGRATTFLMALVLVTGCVGHLEFDPHADAGAGTVSTGNDNIGNNTGAVGNSAGSGGGSGNQGTGGTGGQALASGSGGGDGSGKFGGAAPADAGGLGAPPSDAGVGTGADAGTLDAVVAATGCQTSINVLADVFAAKCGNCHGATAPTKNLDLVSAGLGARMVNKISTCKNEPLIAGTLTNGKPTGLLFQKLAGKVTDCGVQMPAGAAPLSAAEIACVNDWAVAAIAKVTGK